MTTNEIMEQVVKTLDTKKAVDIIVLDILELSTLGDYFVIASGTSSTHVKALVNDVAKALSAHGVEPKRIQGNQGAKWVLMDYLDTMVHIFDNETRDFYQLERLWGDAKPVDISRLLSED